MNPSSTLKTIMFWLFIIMLGVLLWTLVSKSGQSAREEEPSYSEFMAQVDRGNVKEVELYLSPTSYEVQGEKREPSKKFRATIFKEAAPDLVKTLRDKNVLINVKEVNRADWVTFLFSAAPCFVARGVLDLHDAADAGRREQGPELRQIARPPAHGAAEKGDFQGRCRHGRSQRRAAGNHRILERPAKIPEAGRAHPERRAAGRASRNG